MKNKGSICLQGTVSPNHFFYLNVTRLLINKGYQMERYAGLAGLRIFFLIVPSSDINRETNVLLLILI